MTTNLKIGQRATTSGFPCTILRLYSGEMNKDGTIKSGMVEVRVPGGIACVDVADVRPDGR